LIQMQSIIDDLDRRFPGFKIDHAALAHFYECLAQFKTLDNHKKAIKAMCAVVFENYSGILALTASSHGLPAQALSRNLFEVIASTMYLLFNPALLTEFTDFGKLVTWTFARNSGPTPSVSGNKYDFLINFSEPQYQALRKQFPKGNWHGLSVKDLMKALDGHLGSQDSLGYAYRVFYKTASSVVHGDVYPILHPLPGRKWKVGADRAVWNKHLKFFMEFDYLLVAHLYQHVNERLKLGFKQKDSELEKRVNTILKAAKVV